MNYIKKIDFLGSNILFKFNGSTTNKTILGGFLSFITTVLILITGLYQIIELSNKTNPFTYTSTRKSEFVNLNLSRSVPIMFTIFTGSGSLLTNVESYLTIQSLAIEITKNSTTNLTQTLMTNIDIIKCTRNFIIENYGIYSSSFLQNFEENNSFCVPLNQSKYFLSGLYGEQNSHFINFYFVYCDNSTSSVPCKPLDVIKQQVTFNIRPSIPDYYFDHSNFENPGVPYLITKVIPIYTTLSMKYMLTFKNVQYKTDSGLVGNTISEQNYFLQNALIVYPSLIASSAFKNAIGGFVLSFDSYINEVYSRSYTKIPSILAQLGGSFNVLFYASLIINYYFENKLKDIEIFNTCCDQNLFNLISKNTQNYQKENFFSDLREQKSNIIIENRENSQNQQTSKLQIEKSTEFVGRVKERLEIVQVNNYLLKSVLFGFNDINEIIELKISLWDFLKCKKDKILEKKIVVIDAFITQIFDIGFILRNVLEAHIILSNKKPR